MSKHSFASSSFCRNWELSYHGGGDKLNALSYRMRDCGSCGERLSSAGSINGGQWVYHHMDGKLRGKARRKSWSQVGADVIEDQASEAIRLLQIPTGAEPIRNLAKMHAQMFTGREGQKSAETVQQ